MQKELKTQPRPFYGPTSPLKSKQSLAQQLKKRLLTTCFASLLTLAGPAIGANASADKTTILPFEAHYSAKWNKVALRGLAVRKLTINNNNQLEFSFNAKTLAAKVKESSQFSWHHCSPKPSSYLYERKGFLKKKTTLQQTFNWKEQQVTSDTNKYTSTFDLSAQSTDKLSYQLAIRCDLKQGNATLNYQVVDKTRLKQYAFKVIAEETLETPLGVLKTVKVERIRGNQDRQTFLWFAKELDYLLVKLEQFDTGGNHYVINIKTLQNSHATAEH